MYLGGCPSAGQRENIPRLAGASGPGAVHAAGPGRREVHGRSTLGIWQVRVRYMPSRDHRVHAGPNPGFMALGRAARERRPGRERRRSDRRCEGGGGVALDHREGDKEGRALGRGDHLTSGRGLGQVRSLALDKGNGGVESCPEHPAWPRRREARSFPARCRKPWRSAGLHSGQARGTSTSREPSAIPIRHPIAGVLASDRHGSPAARGNALDMAIINLPVDSQTLITCKHVKQLSMARRDVCGCVSA
jgi:hypothetical protein